MKNLNLKSFSGGNLSLTKDEFEKAVVDNDLEVFTKGTDVAEFLEEGEIQKITVLIGENNKEDYFIKARGGVYGDTPQNRKLGRVGQKFGGEKKEEEKPKKKEGLPSVEEKKKKLKFFKEKRDKHPINSSMYRHFDRVVRTTREELKEISKSQEDEALEIIKKAFEEGLISEEQLEKARGGIYKDTAENRKLGKVGQKYGGEKKEEEFKKKEEKIENLSRDEKFSLLKKVMKGAKLGIYENRDNLFSAGYDEPVIFDLKNKLFWVHPFLKNKITDQLKNISDLKFKEVKNRDDLPLQKKYEEEQREFYENMGKKESKK